MASVTDPESGRTFDNCQHAAFRVYGRFMQLIERIDARDSIAIQPRTLLPFVDPDSGQIHSLRSGRLSPPNHLAESMLGFPFLSLGEKLGMRRCIKSLQRMTEQERIALDGTSFADWLADHRQSERAIRRFWGFFTLAALNLPAEEASAAQAAFLFREGLFGDADAFDVACFTKDLSKAIGTPSLQCLQTSGVDVRLTTQARALSFEEDRCVGVETKDGLIPAAAVVLATPHTLAARILANSEGAPQSASEVAGMLGSLETRALIGLHALHPERITPDGFTFAAVIDEPVIQMIFDRDSELDPEERIDGQQWISIPVSGADPWLKRSDEKLKEDYLRVVKGIWPDACEPTSFHVIRSKRATFAPTPGQHSLRPAVDAVAEGLHLAGSYTATDWPSTMESAVRSGLVAAASVLCAGSDGTLDRTAGDDPDWSAWNHRNPWPDWGSNPRRGDSGWREWTVGA